MSIDQASRPSRSEEWTQTFIETEWMRALMAAVFDGVSPIFLCGARGLGKTMSLSSLARKWKEQGRPAVVLSLSQHSNINDLMNALIQALRPVDEEIGIVISSSDSALESNIEAICGSAQDALIMLDDFDLVGDSTSVAKLALRLGQAGIRVVVAMHPDKLNEVRSRFPGAHLTRIDVTPWTREEITELINRGDPQVSKQAIDRMVDVAAGNPRVANLTVMRMLTANGEDILDQGNEHFQSQDTMFRATLAREAERIGMTLETIARPLINLILAEAPTKKCELSPESARIADFPYVVDREGFIWLRSEIVGPAILRALEVLPSSTTSLCHLDFGAEEAERDPLLADQFVPPAGLQDLLVGRRNIVVGDRGAGKSALFTTLARTRRGADNSVQILTLEDPAELVLQLESEGQSLSSADHFRAAWLLSVASTLATQVKTLSPKQTKLAAALREAVPGLTAEGERSSLLKRIFNWLGRSSLKIQLGPVVFGPPSSAGKPGGGRPIDLTEFLRETCTALKAEGRRVIVAVDRIDEVHKYQRKIQEPLVQGLFLAESSPVHSAEITLLIFIRSDLFETYDIQEKNKLVTRRLDLQWQNEALLKMLIQRIFANPSLAALRRVAYDGEQLLVGQALKLLFPTDIDGSPFEEWLWHHTRNGNGRVSPRQLILLLVLMRDLPTAANYQFDTLPMFSGSILQSAMTRLSELSFNEATDDFRVAPTFLRNLRAGKIEEFSLEEVRPLFSSDEGSIAAQVEMLERLGIVERLVVRNKQGGSVQSRMRLPPLYTRCWQQ